MELTDEIFEIYETINKKLWENFELGLIDKNTVVYTRFVKLFEQLKILDESSWQFEFGLAYNKFEAYGDLKTDSEYLIDALNKIPEDKFQKIIYRKLFLDLIYTNLN